MYTRLQFPHYLWDDGTLSPILTPSLWIRLLAQRWHDSVWSWGRAGKRSRHHLYLLYLHQVGNSSCSSLSCRFHLFKGVLVILGIKPKLLGDLGSLSKYDGNTSMQYTHMYIVYMCAQLVFAEPWVNTFPGNFYWGSTVGQLFFFGWGTWHRIQLREKKAIKR